MDVNAYIQQVKVHRASLRPQMDGTDGLSLEFNGWCMNLCGSIMELLLRLSVEAKADQCKVKDILQHLKHLPEANRC